ncbi:MAG: winged helix-turn-helix transcriptional regulator [Solirubrobacterales bacterium]|nr:winged helix-turn-helix transcriptional regulator [Solirubrobacterales bacterium]
MPLNVQVLLASAEQPTSLAELRRAAGLPPQTTMRSHLRALTELRVLERSRAAGFPNAGEYSLTQSGRGLVVLINLLQAWLNTAPEGPVPIGSAAAKNAIKAFVEGWSSTLVRALAARPLALTELDRLINTLNYPSLERRLVAMRLSGLIEPYESGGRANPYVVTPWLRRAIGPLAAAALWELQQGFLRSAPFGRVDVEAVFLLSVPLVEFSGSLSGSCQLVVEIPSGESTKSSGALVKLRNGRVESCVSSLESTPDSWASGSSAAWLRAIVMDEASELALGGDSSVVTELVQGLHGALFDRRRFVSSGTGSGAKDDGRHAPSGAREM